MNNEDYRTEVLELLAKGKITIDEAVKMLDQPDSIAADVIKAEALTDIDSMEQSDVEKEALPAKDLDIPIEDVPLSTEKSPARQPRWLRIHVGDLTTGKSKVRVNIPFGMVKFGLGLAQIFTPEEYGVNLEQIGNMMAEADSGVLVDVEDAEDNEHVRIYIE
ncbi:MAG: hypothetical protein ACK2U0_09355 [Candidatus Promineifilaceae bacterium]|jgi:hypothetical protein